ncbi:SDR family oxidoreductase [bacterium]|nr:SDR family oxidoreductase [bacterium]
MNILFIGGTGIISSACTRLAAEQGFNLTLLNRGKSDRMIPPGVEVIHGDMSDEEQIRALLKDRSFDAVADWIAFTPDQAARDIRLFGGRTGQYIFISSASAYQTPPLCLPVTESTPLCNPFWQYSRDKIACEELLITAYRETGFPVTIVRPSHTYDERTLPFHYQYTVVDRMRRGKPVIIHGDGTSLWTLTHHRDFAKGFTGLLGHPQATGQAFHITSDESLTWNQIYRTVAEAAGAGLDPVHIPSDLLAAWDGEYGPNLLGDKSHSMIFDNSKIKRLVPGFQCVIPFHQGAREIMTWLDAHPEKRRTDPAADERMDQIIRAFERARPVSA